MSRNIYTKYICGIGARQNNIFLKTAGIEGLSCINLFSYIFIFCCTDIANVANCMLIIFTLGAEPTNVSCASFSFRNNGMSHWLYHINRVASLCCEEFVVVSFFFHAAL